MFAEQAGLFRTAVATADLRADVPSCPGWTFTDLALHVARFLHTATRYLTSGSIVELRPLPVRRDSAEGRDPLKYLDEQLAAATQVLRNTSGQPSGVDILARGARPGLGVAPPGRP